MKMTGNEKRLSMNMNSRVITAIARYHFARLATLSSQGDFDITKTFSEPLEVIDINYEKLSDSIFEVTRQYLLDKNLVFSVPGKSINDRLFNGEMVIHSTTNHWMKEVFNLIRLLNKSFCVVDSKNIRHYFTYDDDLNTKLSSMNIQSGTFNNKVKLKNLFRLLIADTIYDKYPKNRHEKEEKLNKYTSDTIDVMLSTYMNYCNRTVRFENDQMVIDHMLETKYLNKNNVLRKVIAETVQLKKRHCVSIKLDSRFEDLCVMMNYSYKDTNSRHLVCVPKMTTLDFNETKFEIVICNLKHDSFTTFEKRTISKNILRWTNYLFEPAATRTDLNVLSLNENGKVCVLEYKSFDEAKKHIFQMEYMSSLVDTKENEAKLGIEEVLKSTEIDKLYSNLDNFCLDYNLFAFFIEVMNTTNNPVFRDMFKEAMNVCNYMSIESEKDVKYVAKTIKLKDKVEGKPMNMFNFKSVNSLDEKEEVISKPLEETIKYFELLTDVMESKFTQKEFEEYIENNYKKYMCDDSIEIEGIKDIIKDHFLENYDLFMISSSSHFLVNELIRDIKSLFTKITTEVVTEAESENCVVDASDIIYMIDRWNKRINTILSSEDRLSEIDKLVQEIQSNEKIYSPLLPALNNMYILFKNSIMKNIHSTKLEVGTFNNSDIVLIEFSYRYKDKVTTPITEKLIVIPDIKKFLSDIHSKSKDYKNIKRDVFHEILVACSKSDFIDYSDFIKLISKDIESYIQENDSLENKNKLVEIELNRMSRYLMNARFYFINKKEFPFVKIFELEEDEIDTTFNQCKDIVELDFKNTYSLGLVDDLHVAYTVDKYECIANVSVHTEHFGTTKENIITFKTTETKTRRECLQEIENQIVQIAQFLNINPIEYTFGEDIDIEFEIKKVKSLLDNFQDENRVVSAYCTFIDNKTIKVYLTLARNNYDSISISKEFIVSVKPVYKSCVSFMIDKLRTGIRKIFK